MEGERDHFLNLDDKYEDVIRYLLQRPQLQINDCNPSSKQGAKQQISIYNSHLLLLLGGCPRMHFHPTLCYFHKNNARNITYMAVLIFPKNLDLRKNAYSRTTS